MSVVENGERPSLIRSLLDPVPTLRFTLKRKGEGGTVKEFPFRCRVLHGAQNIDALQLAQNAAQNKELDGYGDIYREMQSWEVIARFVLQDELSEIAGRKVYLPYFSGGAKQAAESLTEIEAVQILNCYQLTKTHFDLDPFNEAQAEKLIDVLADDMQQSFFLQHVPSQDYPRLIYALARLAQSWRPPISPTQSGSANTSESEQATSDQDTTGSLELPSASSNELTKQPPTDRVLDHVSAWELSRTPKTDKKD